MTFILAGEVRRASLFITLLLLFVSFAAMSQAQSVTVDDFQPGVFADNAGHKLPYRLFIPADYNPAKSYPLVLFLHGQGEAGTDNRKQLVGQKAPLVFVQPENQARWPCFMLAPQCPGGSDDWAVKGSVGPTQSMTLAMELVDAIQTQYSIDPARLYVTGLSSGGCGAWDSITRYPGKFAAGIPICGEANVTKAAAAAQTAIWAFHSADDSVVSVSYTANMVAALRAAGGSPLFTEYDGYNHYCWIPAYSEPGLLPWLFDQTLPTDPMLSASLTAPQTRVQTKFVPITSKPRYQVPNPSGGPITGYWSEVSGPGTVSFGNPSLFGTTAAVSTWGTYVLRQNLTDGINTGGSSLTVTFLGPAPPAPVISAAGRTFTGSGTVTLSDTASQATIYYTLDGSVPTSASPVYSGPFVLTSSATIKAMAQCDSTQSSWVSSAVFTVH